MSHVKYSRVSALPLFLASLALSCGGGGGGDTAPPGGGGGGGDRLSGTMSVLATNDDDGGGGGQDIEPNDTVGEAQVLGDLTAGGSVSITGSIGENGDMVDVFQVIAPSRIGVNLTLNAADGSSDLDALIVDPVSLQAVERFDSNSASESGSFTAKGTFFVVIQAASGSSNYDLSLGGTSLGASIPEGEPNDTVPLGRYLGTFGNSDGLVVTGDGIGDTETNGDCFLLALPAAAMIDVVLDFDATEDYDVFFYDATATLNTTSPFDELFTTNVPEVGNVDMNAMTLLCVEVRPYQGASSTYSLRLEGANFRVAGRSAASTGKAILSQAPRGSSIDLSNTLRGPAPERLFTQSAHPLIPGDVIFQMAADSGQAPSTRMDRAATRAGVERVVHALGGDVKGVVPAGPSRVRFGLPENLDDEDLERYTLALCASLRGLPGVEIAEPNYLLQAACVQQTPNDNFYNLQWHYEQIQLPAAWDLTTGSNSVRIAVLDTGSTPAQDLDGREVQGYDMIDDPAIAGDGDGRDGNPLDVGDSNGAQPSSFHGSHVAGTIGAETNNNYGVAGVTWASQIMHVRVLGIGGGSNFDILNAVLYAAGLPNASGQTAPLCQVQNLSLGGGGFSQASQNAVNDATNAGSLIVAAAGNNNNSETFYPAGYDNVLSVSAVDFDRRKAPYSNFNSTVDIAAPGGDVSADLNNDGYSDGVLSTKPDDSVNPTNFETYVFYNGTSMAAPHVAGVAGLMLALDPTLTPAQLTTMMRETATDLGAPGQDNIFGAGLVNAFAACQRAANGGGGGGGNPVLSLDTGSVLLNDGTLVRRVGVSNVGAGDLQVNTVTATTDDGGSWLTATRVPTGAGGTTDTSSVEIRANTAGLADGSFSGNVRVESNGGAADIEVALTVGGGGGTIPDYDVFVLVVEATSLTTVAQVTVNTLGDLRYGFPELAAGGYVIVAGTDEDDDGFICDDGEPLCGLYPSLGLATRIDLGPTGSIGGLDFPLQSAASPTGQGAPIEGFQLLSSSR